MAELELGGEPLFVEVNIDQQYPNIPSIEPLTSVAASSSYHVFAHELALPQIAVEPQPEEVPEEHKEIPEEPEAEKPAEVKNELALIAKAPVSKEATTAEQAIMDACVKIQNRRIQCPECKRFTCETEEKMLRHIRKNHRGENPFQCYMCDYSTYNKSLFEEHVRIHQGIKPFKCSYCPYRSAAKKNTKKHELIHRPDNPLKCDECSFIARHSKGLLAHKKNHSVAVVLPVSSGKTYNCPHCPLKYKQQHQLRNHKKQKRKCPDCSYVACSKSSFSSHMMNEHCKDITEPKSTIFQCALCKWSSSNKPRILLHLIHHPNQFIDESVIDVSILKKHGIMQLPFS